MKADRQQPTLHRPAVYEIRVPGEFDESWADWLARMSVSVESEGEGSPVTTLTGAVDQAALHSVLRRLYSLGLPLISATCVEFEIQERRNEMTVESWLNRREERRGFQALWWAGTLLWAGLVFGADSLGWLPQIGQADAWTWVFLGAGLYGLIGTLYRQISVDALNPRAWDYLWSGSLLAVALGGVAGVNISWSLVLILAGVIVLVSALCRS
jgi:hypothetical protein